MHTFKNISLLRGGRQRGSVFAAVVLPFFAATTACGAVPTIQDVQKLFESHLAAKPGYHPGDLITQSDVAPVLRRLEQLGFSIRQKQQGVEPLLPEGHPLVQLLRTPAGTKLMRRMQPYGVAYDRMERLLHFRAGQEIVMKIIETQNIEAVAALCTTETADRLEVQFVTEPSCRNFSSLSGRAYTLEQYLEHVRTMHRLNELKLSRPAD